MNKRYRLRYKNCKGLIHGIRNLFGTTGKCNMEGWKKKKKILQAENVIANAPNPKMI